MTAPMPLGASLTTAPPRFTAAQAAQAARTHFGIEGEVTALSSERDANFKITSDKGRFVLKLSNPAEPYAVTEFQTLALVHLEQAQVPVPRVQRSLTGQILIAAPQGTLRMLTYLEGRMLYQVPPSADLRRSLGAVAARLGQGLRDFDHPGADHVLQWDIRHASNLRPLLPHVPADLRGLCAAAMDRFEAELAPLLPRLRWQVIHNDLNPHNIVTSADGSRVTGILDFGDMVRTALICDLAIAASYQVDVSHPMDSLTQIAAAYHDALPLTGPEAAALIGLVETRWLTTLCITAARAARSPENAAYILRNAPQAGAGLQAFAALDRRRAQHSLLNALRLT